MDAVRSKYCNEWANVEINSKKTPLEKYKEQKSAIAAMLAAGDITVEVSNQLIEELNAELLWSSLI